MLTVWFGRAGVIAPDTIKRCLLSVRLALFEDRVIDMFEGSRGVSRLDEI